MAPAQGASPILVDDLFEAATTAHRDGRLPQAARLYGEVLAAKPDHFDALHMLGVIKLQHGELGEALRLMLRALETEPRSPDVLINYGLTLNALNRLDEALASFDAAIAIKPDAAAYNNRGSVLNKLGRFDEAIASYARAIALQPDYPEAFFNRSNVYIRQKRYVEALKDADRAIALRPNYVKAHNNRANALNALHRYQESLQAAERAVALDPHSAAGHYSRGNALARLGRHAEALEAYQRAVALDPNHAEAQWNEALTRLRLGDLRGGFDKYEWGWMRFEAVEYKRRNFARPVWNGEPLSDRRILVHAEQGLGDTIHMARYVPLLAQRGGRVLLEAQPTLTGLLRSLSGVAQVIGRGEPLPDFDLHCPMMHLPKAFRTDLGSIPATVPYLSADPARVAAWRDRLPPRRGLRVGLVWSGNKIHSNDYNRSMRLAEMAPLLDIDGVDFIGLVKEVREGDAAMLAAEPRIASIGPQLADFSDTAAVVAQLDLVITVDTAVAHLAGALAKPVWILIPFFFDWRWLIGRSDSPWYPTARLFRQPVQGDWKSPIAAVGAALGRMRTSGKEQNISIA